jgi:hypothetical protein
VRLTDHLKAQCGTEDDIGGIFTNISKAIESAERFELTDDVARACYHLTQSKPSSLLSAMPLCRAPFRSIWLEWRGGLVDEMEYKRDPMFAPKPIKQGCLIETDETYQCGMMTFAWVHKERPNMAHSPVNVSPLGTLFDWSEHADIKKDALADLRLRLGDDYAKNPVAVCEVMLTKRWLHELSDDEAGAFMKQSVYKGWDKFASLSAERGALQKLSRHAIPWISPHVRGFFEWVAPMAMENEKQFVNFARNVVGGSWEADIEGEPPFADTVIAMMNSRNAIEHRSVDLSALNKSRVKRGRQPFIPYRTTHLRLSQAQQRAFRAGLLSREDAGRHRVRGHFKIRKTGVYWWSPFFRGDPNKPTDRTEYKVVTT